MKNNHIIFLPSCRLWISLSHRDFYFFMDKYWLRHAHLYFTLQRFSVLVTTKHKKNSPTSINMNSCHTYFLPSCRVWISLYHRYFDIFPGRILVYMCSFLFHITQIQCLGDHKIVGKWL